MRDLTKRLRVLFAPRIHVSKNIYQNFSLMANLLRARSNNPRVLVIGSGSRRGVGMVHLGKKILEKSVNLDLFKYPDVQIIGDAHCLPFKEYSFDGVVIQDVLEHVKDPKSVVLDIYRVLRPSGIVFSITPFIQVFHPEPLDYRRYSIPGKESLFSDFKKIKSGIAVGPSSAVVHVLTYYLAILFSFNNNIVFRILLAFFGWILSPLILLDYLLLHHRRSYLLAREIFFLGEKTPPI